MEFSLFATAILKFNAERRKDSDVTVHSRVNHSADCTEDARFDLNVSRPIAKGDLKWRDALLVAHRVNSNILTDVV